MAEAESELSSIPATSVSHPPLPTVQRIKCAGGSQSSNMCVTGKNPCLVLYIYIYIYVVVMAEHHAPIKM